MPSDLSYPRICARDLQSNYKLSRREAVKIATQEWLKRERLKASDKNYQQLMELARDTSKLAYKAEKAGELGLFTQLISNSNKCFIAAERSIVSYRELCNKRAEQYKYQLNCSVAYKENRLWSFLNTPTLMLAPFATITLPS